MDGTDILPMAEHSLVLSTLNSNGLYILITTHYNKKFLWPGLEAAQTYGYKHKYLESSLTA